MGCRTVSRHPTELARRHHHESSRPNSRFRGSRWSGYWVDYWEIWSLNSASVHVASVCPEALMSIFKPHSMHCAPGVFKTGNDSNYRTVPKHGSRRLLPARTGWIENRFVPVKSSLNTTIRLRLRRSSRCAVLQFRGHDMLRVPELTHSAVRDSSERAATRRSPNPSGRQQLIVATELKIAASDTEMPVPCFKPSSTPGPRRRRDAPCQREEERS
jgi:hypothetical protein